MLNLIIIAVVLFLAEIILQGIAGKIATEASDKGKQMGKLAKTYFIWFFILQNVFVTFLYFIGLL